MKFFDACTEQGGKNRTRGLEGLEFRVEKKKKLLHYASFVISDASIFFYLRTNFVHSLNYCKKV